MVEEIETPGDKLDAVKSYIYNRLTVLLNKGPVTKYRTRGRAAIDVEEAAVMSGLVDKNCDEETKYRLLTWYKGQRGDVYKELYDLVEDFLLAVGLIGSRKEKPDYFLDGKTVDETIENIRAYLLEIPKDHPDRDFYEKAVKRWDIKKAKESGD